jgi:hypothetical protein
VALDGSTSFAPVRVKVRGLARVPPRDWVSLRPTGTTGISRTTESAPDSAARRASTPGRSASMEAQTTRLPKAGTVTAPCPPTLPAPPPERLSSPLTGDPVVLTTCKGSRAASPTRNWGGTTGST